MNARRSALGRRNRPRLGRFLGRGNLALQLEQTRKRALCRMFAAGCIGQPDTIGRLRRRLCSQDLFDTSVRMS
jgi:hypothetical protein